MHPALRFFASLLVAAVIAAASLSTLAAEGKGKTFPKSDEELASLIRARFAASKIGANGFVVNVRGGIATLEGTARVPQHKGVATRLAKLAGAKQVRNLIKTTGSPAKKTTKPKASAGDSAPSGAATLARNAEAPDDAPHVVKTEPADEKPRRLIVRFVPRRR